MSTTPHTLKPFLNPNHVEVGVDEVGRGCLAGPVVAAAVILPQGFYHPLLNDSKKVRPEQRTVLSAYIHQHALAVGIGEVNHKRIDEVNILNATMEAMHQALDHIQLSFDVILVDGHYFKPYHFYPYHTMIKGDAQWASIAAASIVAKTYRDDLMTQLNADFPQYGWASNKGYGTAKHIAQIRTCGYSPYHRRTFNIDKKR